MKEEDAYDCRDGHDGRDSCESHLHIRYAACSSTGPGWRRGFCGCCCCGRSRGCGSMTAKFGQGRRGRRTGDWRRGIHRCRGLGCWSSGSGNRRGSSCWGWGCLWRRPTSRHRRKLNRGRRLLRWRRKRDSNSFLLRLNFGSLAWLGRNSAGIRISFRHTFKRARESMGDQNQCQPAKDSSPVFIQTKDCLSRFFFDSCH